MITLNIDTTELKAALGDQTKRVINRATASALNSSAKDAKAYLSKVISQTYDMQITQARANIYIVKATIATQTALIRFSEKRIPLSRLKPNRVKVNTGHGVRYGVSVIVDGVRTFVPGVFQATMPNGGRSVFKRRGPGRLPIDKAYADLITALSSIAAMLEAKPQIRTNAEKLAQESFGPHFDQAFALASSNALADIA